GQEPHRAAVVEAIEDTAHGLIGEGLRRAGLAQEQCGVLLSKALFQAIQRAAATARIPHQAQHDRPRVHVHLRRDIVIDKANETELVGVSLDNRPMVDRVHRDGGWEVLHGSLPQGTLAACSVLAASSSHGYGLCEAKIPAEKMRLITNLRG